jgi:hypothetical protein
MGVGFFPCEVLSEEKILVGAGGANPTFSGCSGFCFCSAETRTNQ